jgi:transposase
MAEFRRWLLEAKAQTMIGSYLDQAINYPLDHWTGLTRFLDDGRLEIDSNTVERALRPICLTRKVASLQATMADPIVGPA